MAVLNKKIAGSSLMETLVAMVIIVIVFSAVMLLCQWQLTSSPLLQWRARMHLDQFVQDVQTNGQLPEERYISKQHWLEVEKMPSRHGTAFKHIRLSVIEVSSERILAKREMLVYEKQ